VFSFQPANCKPARKNGAEYRQLAKSHDGMIFELIINIPEQRRALIMEDIFKFTITLVSLGVAYYAAKHIGKVGDFRKLSERQGRDVALDGLRGYLALSVFFHHLVVTWTWKNSGVWASSTDVYFLNYGKVGVFIFFMITGYLFVGKLIRYQQGIDWFRLFESRIFRILPLYLLALLLITLIVAWATHFQVNVSSAELLREYGKWFVFHGSTINGFEGTKTIIAEVDWTLKYEWLFYLSLPLIATVLKIRYGGTLMLLLCVALFLMPVQVKQFTSVYFILFSIGGLAAMAIRHRPRVARLAKSPFVTLVALTSLLAAIFYPHTMDGIHILLITVFFGAVVMGNDMFGLLSRQASIVLGEISYSIYLLHGVILYLLFTVAMPDSVGQRSLGQFLTLTPFLSVLVVAVSALTFSYVEKPAMRIGRKYHLSRILSNLIAARKSITSNAGANLPSKLEKPTVKIVRRARDVL